MMPELMCRLLFPVLVLVKNKVVNDGVSLIDIMPTILDYAKIKIPKTVQGISLLPLLENKPGAKGRDLVFSEHHAHGSGTFLSKSFSN